MDFQVILTYLPLIRPLKSTASFVARTTRAVLLHLISISKNCLKPPSPTPSPTPRPKAPLIIFLLGAPGSGKGTQSALLQRALLPPGSGEGLAHLSYGDLVRAEDAIPGSLVNALPRRGAGSASPVVPAHVAAGLVYEALRAGAGIETEAEAEGEGKGADGGGEGRGESGGEGRVWLVDGFPRTAEHVEAWAALMGEKTEMGMGMGTTGCVVYLDCPREKLVRRVLGRAEAAAASALGRGRRRQRRPDDAVLELVEERVGRSLAERDALIAALEKHGLRVVEIDASREIGEVGEEVLAVCRETIDCWMGS